MIGQILLPLLAYCGLYFLALSQHENHTLRVLVPAELSGYFIVGEWFHQAVGGDIVEIEDASYFDMFPKTTHGVASMLFRENDQDESTHASFSHPLIIFPTSFCANKLAFPPSGSGNAGVSTKTTGRYSSNVHRTYPNSFVQGDNPPSTSNSISSAAVFINLSPV